MCLSLSFLDSERFLLASSWLAYISSLASYNIHAQVHTWNNLSLTSYSATPPILTLTLTIHTSILTSESISITPHTTIYIYNRYAGSHWPPDYYRQECPLPTPILIIVPSSNTNMLTTLYFSRRLIKFFPAEHQLISNFLLFTAMNSTTSSTLYPRN